MKTRLLFLFCLLSITLSQSQTFNDGVLEYTVTDATNHYVSVKKYNDTCPTGDLTIPETIVENGITYTITSLANFAFDYCDDLTSVNIPESVTSIGGYAFELCRNITSVNIPNGITRIENGTFTYCHHLTSVSIPNGVTSIGNIAFQTCIGLSSVNIPDSVTSIETSAFFNCSSLTTLNIPNSVTSIGDKTFQSCTGLTNVTVNWAVPLVIDPNVFQDVDIENVSLTIPSGTESAYQATAVWQDFGSFVLSTSDFESANAFQLYPNPATEKFTVMLPQGAILKKISLYNSLGQYVTSTKETSINTSNLSHGLYFIEVETNKGESSKKLIIE